MENRANFVDELLIGKCYTEQFAGLLKNFIMNKQGN